MSAGRFLRAAVGATLVAGVAAGCFYHPPERLPSSIRVIYSKAKTDSLGSSTDIWFLVAKSGNELRLTGDEGADTEPAFAAKTLRVYFHRVIDGRDEIWSMEFDGSDERKVMGEDGAELSEPAISPDESTLAYTRVANGRSEVWLADADGTNPRPLVEGAGWSQPDWSPDGRTLVLTGRRDGTPKLYTIAATGGDPRPLAPADPAPQQDPAWSPDGARVAYRQGAGTGAEIAVVEVASGAVSRLTHNDSEDTRPAWSPSGDRIVFTSHRPHDRWNLWTMGSDGSDVNSLTSSDDSDAADPEWL